jgi:CheY-like chemotaxis protein
LERERIKILIIEDNPGDVELIRQMLEDDEDTEYIVSHSARLYDGIKSSRAVETRSYIAGFRFARQSRLKYIRKAQ